jgi:membrane protein DedA with SNARE-associated domain
VLRYGGRIGLNAARLAKVEAAFARYGPVAVAAARFVNVLRQLNGVVAGSMAMPWRRFLVFNALGGALWVLTWTVVGYYVGLHGADIVALTHQIGHAGLVVAFLAAAGIVAYLYRGRTRLARPPEQ